MTIGCAVLPPSLRVRIAGAVMRLPGTGDGVARLVEVSMVKVDMAALLAALGFRSQSPRRHGSSRTPRVNGHGFEVAGLSSRVRSLPEQKGHANDDAWIDSCRPDAGAWNRGRACRAAQLHSQRRSSRHSDPARDGRHYSPGS